MTGDWVQADYDAEQKKLFFTKEAEGLEVHAMARILSEEMPHVKVATACGDLPALQEIKAQRKN